MTKIMVVDDDKYIRELVCTLLKNEGFSILKASDGEEALEKFDEEKIDLCVIDIMMPRMNGYELCGNIREYYGNIPILMLTAKGDISGKVKGFNTGCDDYLTKPFENQELIVRVRALLKRYNISSEKTIKVGKIIIDRNSYNISVDNEIINMPMKEFELLYKLAGSAGRVFTREQLIEEIWGYSFEGNDRTLDVHINRIRDRFPQDKYDFKITTIRGLGYRLENIHERK